jgi:tetratricopeptide (TPR) repeat protein
MAGPSNPRQSGAHDYHIHVFHTGEYIKPQTIWLKFCAFCAFLWQSTHMLCARRFILAVVVLSLLASQLIAQSAPNADGEFAVLIDGLGNYSRPISTKSELAQKFFDQGLRLVYGYYSPEATASFKEALRHDPDNPMLHWGLALALGPIPNSRFLAFPDDPKAEGRKAIAAARANASKGTGVEQSLIETLSVRYDSERYLDRDLRDAQYIEAARKTHEQYPKDLEAAYLYVDSLMTHMAWSYWKRDGSPLSGTREAVRTLDRMLALNPNHPGAVHLYIHLFESSAHPERALPQADRLESLMPREGHMVHMPSHIYVRTGDYEKAIASNQRSLMVDRDFQKDWGDRATPNLGTYGLSSRTHARHAWDFIRYAAMHAGNYARAMEAARATTVGTSHQGMGGSERAASIPLLINKIFGKWDAVLAEPEPAHGSAYLRGLWHYARGSAFVAQRKFDKAAEELKALQAASADPSVKAMLTLANPAPTILELSALGLEGELLSAQGQHDEAVKRLERAVSLQESLRYVEPPDWGQSMRLYLGAALLRAGRARQAELVYREDLKEFRNNGWSLFGLAQSLRAQGKSSAARKAEQDFERAWKNADVTLKASVF